MTLLTYNYGNYSRNAHSKVVCTRHDDALVHAVGHERRVRVFGQGKDMRRDLCGVSCFLLSVSECCLCLRAVSVYV